jgi:hypothetical protein
MLRGSACDRQTCVVARGGVTRLPLNRRPSRGARTSQGLLWCAHPSWEQGLSGLMVCLAGGFAVRQGATARGDEPAIQRHGTQMVACWEAVTAAAVRDGLQRRAAPPEAAARRESCSQEGELVIRDCHIELSAGRIRAYVLDRSAQFMDEAL